MRDGPLRAARSWGLWALALAVGVGCREGAGSYEGRYRTSWGLTVATQRGDLVQLSYPRGLARCTARGDRLECRWASGPTEGRAAFARRGDTLEGTFGFAESDSDGGAWVMVRER